MKHEFMEHDGSPVRVGEAPGFPYCIYNKCIHCKNIFCNNGCDDLEEECPEAFEALFEWKHLIDTSGYDLE